jgi:hypothetical protein
MRKQYPQTFLRFLPSIFISQKFPVALNQLLLLLDFEVKSSAGKMREAAKQMAERNKMLKGFHEDILDDNWCYVRVLVLPSSSSPSEVCNYCSRFILDASKLSDLGRWFERLTEMQPNVFPVDHQYENLVTRIVGFLLVSDCNLPYTMQMTRKLNEMAVVGTELGITSEHPLQEDLEVMTLKGDEEPDGNEKKKPARKQKKGSEKASHLSSLRTVALWNKEQLGVLQSGRKQVILDADYGCGKTLLLKSAALQLAAKQNESGKKIFFISAASASSWKVSDKIFLSKHLYIIFL